MKPVVRSALRAAAAAALVACAASPALARGFIGIDVGIGFPAYAGWYGPGVAVGWDGRWGGWWPGLYPAAVGVALAAPVLAAYNQPVYAMAAPVAAPPQPMRVDPVIYPRNGQSAQQTEADHQGCDRWATTQPAAMADASVFRRAVEACMDAHGYTLR